MDSVVGMEGNGPGSGDPRRIGVVIAGADPVAVDAVSSKLLGLAPERLPILRAAAVAGIGETQLDLIKVLGEPLSDVVVRHFRLPPQAHLEWRLPEWARRSLKNAFTTKPLIDHTACIQCGICQGHCPQGAIETKGNVLDIRYRNCIRCFCCQEFRPQGAITVGKGWGLKITGLGRNR
jgi:Pyruvate/2-oxoacid:ferredoxin oxidoreductase delta subunit